MSKKTRTFLFYSCVILFLIAAPLVLLYFQGYRIDLNPPKDGSILTQTGGLYFKIIPAQTIVSIDGKTTKKSDFFFSDVFIKNLLPKTYNIKITKDGYFSWEKNLEVKKNLVTEAKNVVLIPQNADLQTITDGVQDFFISPDGTKIIYKKTNALGKNDNWSLIIFDTNKNAEIFLTDNTKLAQVNADFEKIWWLPDSKRILLETIINEAPKYFVFDIENQSPASSISPTPIVLDALRDAQNVSFDYQNPSRIFYIRNNNVYYIDYKTKIVRGPIFSQTTTSVLAYSIYKDGLFILDSNGFILSTDLVGRTLSKINTKPFSVKKETGYEIIMNFPDIFIKENDNLFYYNREIGTFENIVNYVDEVAFSRDSKKMLIYTSNEIWVRYMTNVLDQPAKKIGELQLVARLSDGINNVFWLTDHYLIFNTKDKIKIAEIDDRDKFQIWDFADLVKKNNDSKILWNGYNKTLYVLNNEIFYSSSTLLK